MSTDLRPPDAGTANEWTFAGHGKVYAWSTGLPAVLGRPELPSDGLIAIRVGGPDDWKTLVITPHQAAALMEILPAAIVHANDERCPACGGSKDEGSHGMSEYGGCV